MPSPTDEDRTRSYATPQRRRRRRYSVWTLLAPAAVAVLWISFFSALGQSCMFKECKDSSSDTTSAESSKLVNDEPATKIVLVRRGDTLGGIAKQYNLSTEDLLACNPKIDPQTLPTGARLKVAASVCQGAKQRSLDAVAANESGNADDPAAESTTNGTAAADPSVGTAGDAGADD